MIEAYLKQIWFGLCLGGFEGVVDGSLVFFDLLDQFALVHLLKGLHYFLAFCYLFDSVFLGF